VGDSKIIKVDVKIICGTNQDLTSLVNQNKFRRDLLYRINQFKIMIPPLRERKDDIELLLKHYLNKFNTQYQRNITFDNIAFESLKEFNFEEGNVRELHGIIENLVLFAKSIINFDLIKEKAPQVLEKKTTALNSNNVLSKQESKSFYPKINVSDRLSTDEMRLIPEVKDEIEKIENAYSELIYEQDKQIKIGITPPKISMRDIELKLNRGINTLTQMYNDNKKKRKVAKYLLLNELSGFKIKEVKLFKNILEKG
jgi:transcriptional regulator with GAF, ATPase, and Fis domain